MTKQNAAIAATSPSPSGGQLIDPPVNFHKHVVQITGNSTLDMGPIERAEKALAGLADQFPTWMQDEIAALVGARAMLQYEGLTEASRQRIYLAAHNLRGQAQMMNFPLVGTVSDSLCNLIDRVPIDQLPLPIIDLHIEAARAMISENASGESNGVALKLAAQLGIASEGIIRKSISTEAVA